MISKQPSARITQAGTLATESPLRDLEAIIRSRTPLIAVESNEEPQIVSLVRRIGGRLQLKAYRWTVTEGLQAFEAGDQPQQSVVKSQEILNYIKSSASHSLFVLLDFHPYLEDAVHVRYLKDIALTYAKHWSTVVLVGCAVHGLSRRMLGALLTWMSERRKPVFVVATANDIARLPPEMVRKGRFDEIFFVDLPSAQNRCDILTIHLRKRCLDPAEYNLEALARAADGFSGSEIEQAIVSAMYTAHAQGRTLTQDDLLAEIRQTRPLSVVMAEKVDEIRDWARDRTVPCD